MVNKKVVEYIIEGKKRGFSIQLLKKKLLEGGFSEGEINEATSEINGGEKPVLTNHYSPTQSEDMEKPEATKIIKNQHGQEKMKILAEHDVDAFREEKPKPKEEESFFKDEIYRKINPEIETKRIGLFSKLGKSFTNPNELFFQTRPEGIIPAFLYLLVILIIPLSALTILTFFFVDFFITIVASNFGASETGIAINVFLTKFNTNPALLKILYVFILVYAAIPALTFLFSGIFHLFIKVFGGNGSFSDTYRFMVYSSTPCMLFFFIPFINIVALVWGIVLYIFGISINHKISKTRAFFILLTLALLVLVGWLGNAAIGLYGPGAT